jgi:hypothetical protein
MNAARTPSPSVQTGLPVGNRVTSLVAAAVGRDGPTLLRSTRQDKGNRCTADVRMHCRPLRIWIGGRKMGQICGSPTLGFFAPSPAGTGRTGFVERQLYTACASGDYKPVQSRRASNATPGSMFFAARALNVAPPKSPTALRRKRLVRGMSGPTIRFRRPRLRAPSGGTRLSSGAGPWRKRALHSDAPVVCQRLAHRIRVRRNRLTEIIST